MPARACLCLVLDFKKCAFKFRSCTKKQFSFEIVKQKPRISAIGWKPLTHDIILIDKHFDRPHLRCTRHKQQYRKRYADQYRRIKTE